MIFLGDILQYVDCRWLLIAQAYRGLEARQEEVWYRRPEHAPQQLEIHLKGEWAVKQYDTLSGEIRSLDVRYWEGQTIVPHDLYGNDSLLLRLEAVRDGERAVTGEKQAHVSAQGAEKRIICQNWQDIG